MIEKLFKTCLIGIVWVSATAGFATKSIASLSYETIFLTGDAAPGLNGAVYSNLAWFYINSSGQTVFHGLLSGDEINDDNDWTVWQGTPGSYEIIAREGDIAPGTSSARFTNFDGFYLGREQGRSISLAELAGPEVDSSNNFGIWAYRNGTLSKIAVNGDSATGAGPDATFVSLMGYPSMNLNGQIAFSAQLTASQDYPSIYGLWVDQSGVQEMIARDGDPAPGADGAVFVEAECCGYYARSLDSGAIVFRHHVKGSNVTDANDVGFWSYDSGVLSLVLREGQTAPGTGGAVFSGGTDPLYDDISAIYNHSGAMVIISALAGNGVNTSNDRGIWSNASGSLQLIVREGDAAPGATGATFTYIDAVSFDDSEQIIIFGSALTPEQDRLDGLWSVTGDSMALLVKTGDAVPDIPGAIFSNPQPPTVNDNGNIIFSSSITGPGIDTTNNYGLWSIDADGNIQLIARRSDLFDVNDDPAISDLRRIEGIPLGGLSNNDQAALRLRFEDGSQGLFFATIPEPGTAVMLLTSTGLLLRRRCC